MLKLTEKLTGWVLFLRILAEGIAWGALSALAIMCLILVSTALGNAHAASWPAPGMTCTYTSPMGALTKAPARTYEVAVLTTFEDSYERDGRPWLWVKRPGQEGYQSVVVPPATLSECR
jgi:hypothetical protein